MRVACALVLGQGQMAVRARGPPASQPPRPASTTQWVATHPPAQHRALRVQAGQPGAAAAAPAAAGRGGGGRCLQEESNLVVGQRQVDVHQAVLHGGLQRVESVAAGSESSESSEISSAARAAHPCACCHCCTHASSPPPHTRPTCTTWCSPMSRRVRDTSARVRVKLFCRARLSAISPLHFWSRYGSSSSCEQAGRMGGPTED